MMYVKCQSLEKFEKFVAMLGQYSMEAKNIRILVQILLSSSKNSKKSLDPYCFVISLFLS